MPHLRLPGISLILAASLTGRSSGACSLHSSPLLDPTSSLAFEVEVRQVAFNLSEAEGSYSQVAPSAQFSSRRGLLAGLELPLTRLQLPGGTDWGLSNPMVFAEYRYRLAADFQMGFGAQVDLPFGDADKGLAVNHFMLTPYLSWGGRLAAYFFHASMGSALALDFESEGHAAHNHAGSGPPLYVEPHEKYETLYRLSGGMRLLGGKVSPEAVLRIQQVLARGAPAGNQVFFPAVSGELPWKLGRSVLAARLDLPITSESRFEWGLSVSAQARM